MLKQASFSTGVAMRHCICCLFFVAFLSATLLPQSGAPAPATPQASTPPGASTSNSDAQDSATASTVVKVKTRLVIVDVVARDKKGQIVPDLQGADFKVKEDGKEQKVTVFSFQHPGAATAEGSPQPELPPNVYRNTPKFRSNSALNVILLDGLNSTLLNQFYVRAEMVNFLEKLPQGQPIAIYALGKRLRLLQDFTTDLTEVKRIVRLFKGESSHVSNNPTGTSEVPMTLQGIAEQIALEFAPGFKHQIDDFAQETDSNQMDFRVSETMEALASLARTLAGYPGRKNLIWITESVPVHLFAKEYEAKIEVQGSSLVKVLPSGASEARTRRSYDDQMALISNLFADAQVAVYPIDARGLVGSPFYNVANQVSGQAAMGGLAMRMEGRQAEELFEAHSTMLDMAEKTGGKAFYNRNNIDGALLGDMDDGSTYYTLGYYPENKRWDGKFRKIQVSVNRADVKVRYRAGYFAMDRIVYEKDHPRQRDLDLGTALDPNVPVATALQFQAAVLPPSVQAPNKIVVRYAIDPHELWFDVGPDGLRRGQLDCVARAFSPKDVDHPVKTEGNTMATALKPEVYDKINRTWFPCEISMELPAGQYFLRLVVRDDRTGLVGSLNAHVVVPSSAAAGEKSAPK